MRTEKVYAVEFMSYTNSMENTVSDKSNCKSGKITYLDVGVEPFLITESQMEFYSKFGGGFRSLSFVGNISVPFDIDFGESEFQNSAPVWKVNDSQVVPNKEDN